MPRRFNQTFKDQIIQDCITNKMTIKEISMPLNQPLFPGITPILSPINTKKDLLFNHSN